jgi:hypothetical protein
LTENPLNHLKNANFKEVSDEKKPTLETPRQSLFTNLISISKQNKFKYLETLSFKSDVNPKMDVFCKRQSKKIDVFLFVYKIAKMS